MGVTLSRIFLPLCQSSDSIFGNSKRRADPSLPATEGGRIRDCEHIYLPVLEGEEAVAGAGKKLFDIA